MQPVPDPQNYARWSILPPYLQTAPPLPPAPARPGEGLPTRENTLNHVVDRPQRCRRAYRSAAQASVAAPIGVEANKNPAPTHTPSTRGGAADPRKHPKTCRGRSLKNALYVYRAASVAAPIGVGANENPAPTHTPRTGEGPPTRESTLKHAGGGL